MSDILYKSGKQRLAVQVVVTICAYIPTVASSVFAQEPIRVETNQVVVPVYVEDAQLVRTREIVGSTKAYRALLAGDMKSFYEDANSVVIQGLTAPDFRIFDDGKEQKVQSISYENSLYWDMRDNKGHHTEYIGIGGGQWSTMEWQHELLADVLPPAHYVLSYSLPDSPEGSCHTVKVKVSRQNALVVAREEYCNIRHPASDPIYGSKLGVQLESAIARPPEKGFGISVLAIPFHTESDEARVHITVEWPGKSVKDPSRMEGIIGIVYKDDGSLIFRFSDLADRDGSWGFVHWTLLTVSEPGENRYERQFNLPTGKYELRLALGDGKRFGSAIVPFTIESLKGQNLAISSVSLCKLISDVSANAQKLPGTWAAKFSGSYVPLLSNETEFKPTADMRFKSKDSLYVYFEVFAPLREAKGETVQVQMRVVDLKSGKLVSDPEPLNVASYLHRGNPAIPIGRGIDISRLPKGSYRIEVRAMDSLGATTTWSGTDFSVE